MDMKKILNLLLLLTFALSIFAMDELNRYMLEQHNRIRRSVNPPAKYMPDLVYEEALYLTAKHFAEKCIWGHSDNDERLQYYKSKGGDPSVHFVGENLDIVSYADDDPKSVAIYDWYNREVNEYDYYSNTCTPGEQCGHYTQMVWATTLRLGCAYHVCNGGYKHLYCNYAPGGNIVGRRPYELATPTPSPPPPTPAPSPPPTPAPSPSAEPDELNRYMLEQHNKIRRSVNPPAKYMPDLVYEEALYLTAKHYADQCIRRNSNNNERLQYYKSKGGDPSVQFVGENLDIVSYADDDPKSVAMYDWHMREVNEYDYHKNTCTPGKQCGSYKQIVWANTLRMGCAMKVCDGGYKHLYCHYSPGGNIGGARPYELAPPTPSPTPEEPSPTPEEPSPIQSFTTKIIPSIIMIIISLLLNIF